jgi:hypothetical protein
LKAPGSRSAGLSALDGTLALIAILLVVQMWLLTASLEAFLAGHDEVASPAAALSGVLFVSCLLLLRFVDAIDRRRPRAVPRETSRT